MIRYKTDGLFGPMVTFQRSCHLRSPMHILFQIEKERWRRWHQGRGFLNCFETKNIITKKRERRKGMSIFSKKTRRAKKAADENFQACSSLLVRLTVTPALESLYRRGDMCRFFRRIFVLYCFLRGRGKEEREKGEKRGGESLGRV